MRFEPKDLVRIMKDKTKFSRGYQKKTPEEIYRVVEVVKKFPRVLYKIETFDGKKVVGLFYQEQLTKDLNQH